MLQHSCILLRLGTNNVDSHLKQSSIFNFQDSAKKSRVKQEEHLRYLTNEKTELRKMLTDLKTKYKETSEKMTCLKDKDALLRRRLLRWRRKLEYQKALQQFKSKQFKSK